MKKTSLTLQSATTITSTNGVGENIPVSGLPTNVFTYFLTVYNTGSSTVFVFPAGTNDLTSEVSPHFVKAGESITIPGPLHSDDGQYRLFSTSDSDCIVSLDSVRGEA